MGPIFKNFIHTLFKIMYVLGVSTLNLCFIPKKLVEKQKEKKIIKKIYRTKEKVKKM